MYSGSVSDCYITTADWLPGQAGWLALADWFYQPVQPIAMKEITVAMQNKTKVDIRMSSNPLLEVLRTQFLLNCNTFIFRTIEYYRVEK